MEQQQQMLYDTHTVKEWLITYRETSRELFCQNERLERLEARIVGVGSIQISDMPRNPSPKQDRITDLIALKMELEGAITKEEKDQKIMRDRLEYVLGQIRSADERTVIRMRYVDGEIWEKIAELMFHDREDYDDKFESYLRRVYRDHGYALYHIARYFQDSGDPEVLWYGEMKEEMKNRKRRGRKVYMNKKVVI